MNYLFDLDDTLVHTSEIVLRSMQEWCIKNSIELNEALAIGKGRRTKETVSFLAPHLDAELEANRIEEREAELVERITPLEGAVEFINGLPKSSWAVVTSSSHELAIKKLRICNFPLPKVLISSNSVTTGKPSPEPYNKAIELMQASPSDCVAFEDAESGIESALVSGCKVIIVGEYSGKFDAHVYGRIKTFNQLKWVEGELFGCE